MLPLRLTFHYFAYGLDGGTTVLDAMDESGCKHHVKLVQHAFLRSPGSLDEIPGRLYFDEELIAIRSPIESRLLSLFRNADVKYDDPGHPTSGAEFQLSPNALILGDDIKQVMAHSADENIRSLINSVVAFVESEQYLRCARTVELAADDRSYALWVIWDNSNRNRVIVRLGRMLGIGVQAARKLLDTRTPIAEAVSALEVAALLERYSAEGVQLTVEPAFPSGFSPTSSVID